MPKTLHLTLTYHWWDKIASGEKCRIPPVYGELAQAPSGYTPRGFGSIPPGLHQPHAYPPDRANPRHIRIGLAQRGISVFRMPERERFFQN